MILHERITTTEAKAKTLRPVVEKLVTIAREDTPHHRKLIMTEDRPPAGDGEAVRRRSRRASRTTPGGYTRISKLGPRRGDAAPMALIELVE